MIKLKKELNNYVIKLHKKLLNENLLNENVYILYDDNKICGYVVYKIINNIIKID